MAYRAMQQVEQRDKVAKLTRTASAVEQVYGQDSEDALMARFELRVASEALETLEREHHEIAMQGPGECRCPVHLHMLEEYERRASEIWFDLMASEE